MTLAKAALGFAWLFCQPSETTIASGSVQDKSSGKVGVGCLIVFALPFAGFGVFMAGWAARSVATCVEVRSWLETPCVIVAADVESHMDGEGGTTYEATALYRYRCNGVEFESDRVAIHSGADNIGSFQELKGQQLRNIQRGGGAFRCFVDPEDPTQAILFRDLRPGMLVLKLVFALVFCGVGFGLPAAGLFSSKNQYKKSKSEAAFPDEPWRWREDWASGRIQSSHRRDMFGGWIFAALWNAISWPAAVGVFVKGDAHWWAIALVIAFPIIGVLLLGIAVYATLRNQKWGRCELELATVPGVVGGRLSGVIHASGDLAPRDGIQLTLTCIEQRTRDTSDGAETYDHPLWQSDATIARLLAPQGNRRSAVPVSFHIPFGCRPTDEGSGLRWELAAKADVPGVDFHAKFDVPVYRTSASSTDAPDADDDLLAAYEAPEDFATTVQRCRGRIVRETSSGCQIEFPMGRNLALCSSIALFALIWTSICVGLWYSDAPWIFPIAFSAFGALLWMASIGILFDQSTVVFGGEGVTVRRGMLGFSKSRQFVPAEIAAIVAESSGLRSGNTIYQHVVIKLIGGEKAKLIGQIARRSDAQKMAQKIREAVESMDEEEFGSVQSATIQLEAELPAELRIG